MKVLVEKVPRTCEPSEFRSTCAVCSEPSLGEFWIAIDAKFLHADNKDSDQAARMQDNFFF